MTTMKNPTPGKDFSGTWTALVTPLDAQGQIAWEDLQRLFELQAQSPVRGLLLLGTTGEAATLEHEEQLALVQRILHWNQALGAARKQILVGISANDTTKAVALAQAFNGLAIDGFSLLAPYYNKPSPQGLYLHLSAVAQASQKPILLYSNPGRCGIQIDLLTLQKLVQHHECIVGLKESSGSSDRISELYAGLPRSFCLLSGDDTHTLPFMALGAQGVVSVASNLYPHAVARLVSMAGAGDYAGARALHQRYYPFFKAILTLDANPVPIKAALHSKGLLSTPELRLPLTRLSAEGLKALEATLEALTLTLPQT
jgi:4-hydroxy-tetrahydrodipicolinate synthase